MTVDEALEAQFALMGMYTYPDSEGRPTRECHACDVMWAAPARCWICGKYGDFAVWAPPERADAPVERRGDGA